jgi:precorrin-8X/cobalt-precorrin-8 methylmutase
MTDNNAFESIKLENVLPQDIEKRSFEIITEELGDVQLDPVNEPIIKRVIHTTADFDYLENLYFSENAVKDIQNAIKNGAVIVTDTQMAKSGINKKELAKYGGEVLCFMSDEDVAENAKANGTTRAVASMEKAAKLDRDVIFAIGNAPTALVKIFELINQKKLSPKGIIATPVGFVNVVEAKNLIITTPCPKIVAKGRKGGSNVAAAVCNAILYSMR